MSYDLNVFMGTGRLVKDIEVRYTDQGFAMGKIVVANNVYEKSAENSTHASFMNVKILGKKAESLAPYLQKGKLVGFQGTLKQKKWNKDGEWHEYWVVDNADVKLLGGGSGARPESGSQEQQSGDFGSQSGGGEFGDDIPF